MHRTLDIPEILDFIFAELQPQSDLRSLSREKRKKAPSRRDFAALARTCKRFQGPALDFLWRTQATLVNLLKCLPSHLWEIVEERQKFLRLTERRIRIIGPVHPIDWDIPRAYALRIQWLELDLDDELLSVADVFEMITTGFPHDYLCPNLRGLSFCASDAHFSYIRLFLGPKVVDISLPSNKPPELLGLPIRYPQLQRLYLRSRSSMDELSKVASNLQRIEELDLHKLDRAAIAHLSRLPTLKSLRLHALSNSGSSSRLRSPMDSHTPLFPALRSLHFGDITAEFAIKFFDVLSNSCLADLHIGTAVEKSTCRQLFVALANHLSHSALQTLRVVRPPRIQLDPQQPDSTLLNAVVQGSALAALFCFGNLTKIDLGMPGGLDMDDHSAADMARAWPRVKELRLRSNPRRSSGMSLRGLQAFAQHCPELILLTIFLDASTVPPSDDSPETTVSQSVLMYLDVGVSQIIDSVPVTQFLSKLFTNLAEIWTLEEWRLNVDADDETAAAYDRCILWQRVHAMLPKNLQAS